MFCALDRIAVLCYCFFFFNDTATTEIYTLSLHDALPILRAWLDALAADAHARAELVRRTLTGALDSLPRSEEHTSELQSRQYLVCRLLLEKKKINTPHITHILCRHISYIYLHR